MNMSDNERSLLVENETMRDALQALNAQLDESEAEVERLQLESQRWHGVADLKQAEVERLREEKEHFEEKANHNYRCYEEVLANQGTVVVGELARLHRIEEAAREMFRVIDATKGAQDTRPWSQALRAVLESDD